MSLNFESVVIEARQFYMGIIASKYNYACYYCFEIILSEALILVGYYEEALFYIQEIIDRIKDAVPSFIELSLLETIMLFKTIIYTHTGRRAKAKEIFENINPNKFYFLSKQYLTIFYLSISKILNHKIADKEQVNYLITETGFKRLNSFSKSIDTISSLAN
jgi:tetratricopeptide (TPR) repeat protein